MSKVIIVPVVGITFVDAYPQNLLMLDQAMKQVATARGSHAEGPSVVLKRNPNNLHDSNAIEVHVPAIGMMIGHVPKEIARQWAPKLDAGETPQAWVEQVRVKQGHRDRPGVDIRTVWGAPEPVATSAPDALVRLPEGDTNDYWP